MYKEFDNIDSLLAWLKADKQAEGSLSIVRNRYPIRFVLFDNFPDSYQFVEWTQTQGAHVESVNKWYDSTSEDAMLTYSKLSNKIQQFVCTNDGKQDHVITPFSELARFYDNNERAEFDTLIRTIKGIEAPQEGYSHNQRFYLPIVGLEGKMAKFKADSQIFICYFKNPEEALNYRLTLTNGTTYNVQGLESAFTIARDMQEWLRIWRLPGAKTRIICASPSIFANARFAQPDNAFSFITCNNVYEFLTAGIGLSFGDITYKMQDDEHWLRLASEINFDNFSFESFFNRYFHIDNLADYQVFIKTWFDCKDNFEKWLLCTYYAWKFCQRGYICEVIRRTKSYTDYDFFSTALLTIFELERKEECREERASVLDFAARRDVEFPIATLDKWKEKIQNLASTIGHTSAIRYFTAATAAEKEMSISWLAQNDITLEELKTFYPDLVDYMQDVSITNQPDLQWTKDYFAQYRKSKIANHYSQELLNCINQYNADERAFQSWYQCLKNTKTILQNRKDIEVFYWIDGLGAEWIPFITNFFENKEDIYLNEVFLARANYPTTTAINKVQLQELSNGNLKKIGDLDFQAHQTNHFPSYILEEIKIVKNALEKIVNEYAGRKIAIVSDHGLTAISQMHEGLKLAGVTSDHGGRIAIRTKNMSITDDHYVRCEDGTTLCALRHQSLCSKIPIGQSAHGGCTPEEILVPIFIVSPQKQNTSFTAKLLTTQLSGNTPVIRYKIMGCSDSDRIWVEYAGAHFDCFHTNNDIYESSKINLSSKSNEIILHINDFQQVDNISVITEAEEDADLLDF